MRIASKPVVVPTRTTDDRAALLQQAIRLKRAAARSQSPQLPSRPPEEEAYLGEMQRSLWLLQQLDPDSPTYNLCSAFRVPGELDASQLERGLDRVVSRHRLLRSTFRACRDSAVQIVHPHSPVGIERCLARPGEALPTAVREARRPFDLETGPLIRLLLIEEPAGAERLLVLVLHHILADERSLDFLWQELAEGYDGRAPEGAEPRQYDDFVYWLSGRKTRQRTAELAYWRQRLQPLPEGLRLPFEGPAGSRPGADAERSAADRGTRGRLLRRRLGPDALRRIRGLAATTDTTPFIALAFAFRLLLLRYTQGRNIAFATPASQRSHPATARMIGYFLNPVVICATIDEQLSVERALRDFGPQVRDFLRHASVPFDVLVEELSPPRQRDRHPIFQTMFVYQETPPPPELGGVRLEPLQLDLGESKFDLTVFVAEVVSPTAADSEPGSAADNSRSIEIAVEYRSDRFDAVWMHNLLGHYATLIEHLTEDLELPLADVPMLSAEENDQLRSDARGAPLSTEPALLPQQILDQASRSRQVPAVICGDTAWSYGEFERVARAIAHALAARGVRPGDRVGLFLDRSPLLIAGLLGCHLAGAAYVPLDPAYPSARNLDVLEDAAVAALLTRVALRDRQPAGPAPAIDADRLESEAPGASIRPHLQAEQPAYILYTSGSTGRPKGVIVTHANLRTSTEARLRVYDPPLSNRSGVGADLRFLLLPSIAFDSSVAGLFWTLASGGTLVVPTDDEARDPRRLAQLIVEQKVNSLLCVPSLYGHILAAGKDRLLGLEIVIVAGESYPQQLLEDHFRHLPQTRLFNEYGPTEATVWATVHEISHRDAGEPYSIGRPIPGVRVEVLDERGRRVPAGVPGQGWICGPTVAQGYWRRQDLTDECFIRRRIGADPNAGPEERMYRTGDRLSWTADGRLLFLGRIDEQIKLRGFRIEPGEIEAILLEHPKVEAAAVVARDKAQLVAFVETTAAVEDQREELTKRLPEFLVPNRIVTLAELPRLANGKVDRGRLRKMALPGAGPGRSGIKEEIQDTLAADGERPQILADREQALISLWEGLLGRAGIGATDNFFQLGGHSLLVIEMTSAIEHDLGVDLAPADVFQHPTVRQLARRIEQQSGPGAPAYAHLFPIQPGGRDRPFIFSVPHFFSDMVATRFRGERPVYGLRGVSLRPEGNRGRWRTMRDLGEELVREIGHRFPGEVPIMAGYSFGATMAVEAVRLMEERGMPVQQLILIAPMAVDVYRFGPFRLQIDGLRQPLAALTWQQALRRIARHRHPLSRRPYQRAWRLLAIQPWRRLLCRIGQLRTRTALPLTPRILHADVRLERFRLHARYRPGIVRTPTVIFNASEPETDAAATWRPYFEGPFAVHQIPDPHLGEAKVESAKALILDHLDDLG